MSHLTKQLRRKRERGAAVFVVVLVISLLTALGVFAVKNATLSNKASGHQRQLAQTHYVTDMGVIGAFTELSNYMEESYEIMSKAVPDTATGFEPCHAQNSDTLQFGQTGEKYKRCMLLSFDDINERSMAAAIDGGYATPLVSAGVLNTTPGSFGLPTSSIDTIQPDLRIELTDVYQTHPPPGFQVAGGAQQRETWKFVTVTVTAIGLTRPGASHTTEAGALAAGYEMQRARVVFGPIQIQ